MIDDAAVAIDSVAKSSLLMVIDSWLCPKLESAVMVTNALASSIDSSAPKTDTVVDVEPAGMVTDAGTVASSVSLLVSETTTSLETGVDNETVSVAEPPFSEMSVASIAVDNEDVFWSTTKNGTASLPRSLDAVNETWLSPSTKLSSNAVTTNVTRSCPAGIVTVAGVVASVASDVPNVTTVSTSRTIDKMASAVNVSPSLTLPIIVGGNGTPIDNAAVSSLVTSNPASLLP